MQRRAILTAILAIGCGNPPSAPVRAPLGEVCLAPSPEFLEVAPAGWERDLEAAGAHWETLGGPRLTLDPDCPHQLGLLPPAEASDAIAKAHGEWEGLRLQEGRMRFDPLWLESVATLDDCESGSYLLLNDLAHELGHFYDVTFPGRKDQYHADAVMLPQGQRTCKRVDFSELESFTSREVFEGRLTDDFE